MLLLSGCVQDAMNVVIIWMCSGSNDGNDWVWPSRPTTERPSRVSVSVLC